MKSPKYVFVQYCVHFVLIIYTQLTFSIDLSCTRSQGRFWLKGLLLVDFIVLYYFGSSSNKLEKHLPKSERDHKQMYWF